MASGCCKVDSAAAIRALTVSVPAPILKPAVTGSHVIEPTGPVMGPNAVADVMPLGGRQKSVVRAPSFLIGLQ